MVGGTFQLESAPGGPTTLKLTLPRSVERAATATRSGRRAGGTASARGRSRPCSRDPRRRGRGRCRRSRRRCRDRRRVRLAAASVTSSMRVPTETPALMRAARRRAPSGSMSELSARGDDRCQASFGEDRLGAFVELHQAGGSFRTRRLRIGPPAPHRAARAVRSPERYAAGRCAGSWPPTPIRSSGSTSSSTSGGRRSRSRRRGSQEAVATSSGASSSSATRGRRSNDSCVSARATWTRERPSWSGSSRDVTEREERVREEEAELARRRRSWAPSS